MTDALPDRAAAEPTELAPARVYLDYYQLAEAPFAITPDPDFLFTSGGHQQVLEKITYAVDSRMGFILLTGEVGTGKTTVCRTLLDRLNGRAETVYMINPSVSGRELLSGILEDAGINPETHASKKMLIDQLYRYLLSTEADRPFVVIIDDAQTMTSEALEDLRLLSNLETDKHKLIQVVLSGQPELLDLLDSDRLRQLRQRIAIHCRLAELSAHETGAYISRRLFVAGNQGQVCFSPVATRLIHKKSAGIPRLINKISDYALTAGYVKDAQIIESSHVKWALAELKGLGARPDRRAGNGLAAVVIILLVLFAVTAFTLRNGTFYSKQPTPPAPGIGNRTAHAAPAPGPPGSSPGEPVPVSAGLAPLQISGDPSSADHASQAAEEKATDHPAMARDDGTGSQPLPAVPFALQLGSFRTRERAERDVARYRERGVPAHWQAVGDGRWYRVIAGGFADTAQARHYKIDNGLHKALIINAPLTVKVLPGQPDVSDTEIRGFLSQIGQDCLMEKGPTGDNEIYTGLFLSLGDASAVAERINASNRFLAQVVQR